MRQPQTKNSPNIARHLVARLEESGHVVVRFLADFPPEDSGRKDAVVVSSKTFLIVKDGTVELGLLQGLEFGELIDVGLGAKRLL